MRLLVALEIFEIAENMRFHAKSHSKHRNYLKIVVTFDNYYYYLFR